MDRNIYIEQETIERAKANSKKANSRAAEAIRNGSPEDIREAIQEALERSRDYRTFIRANYNI